MHTSFLGDNNHFVQSLMTSRCQAARSSQSYVVPEPVQVTSGTNDRIERSWLALQPRGQSLPPRPTLGNLRCLLDPEWLPSWASPICTSVPRYPELGVHKAPVRLPSVPVPVSAPWIPSRPDSSPTQARQVTLDAASSQVRASSSFSSSSSLPHSTASVSSFCLVILNVQSLCQSTQFAESAVVLP